MQQDTQRLFQQCQLLILKEVHRICVNHSIPYFLSDGTLLGAVRHEGFIPWDDDIDIGMLREHFDLFLEVCKNDLGEKYFLQTDTTDSGWASTVCRVILNNTCCIERNSRNVSKRNGIFIDIQPYDAVPNGFIFQKLHYLSFAFFQGAIFRRLGYSYKEQRVTIKTFLPKMTLRFVSFLVPSSMLKKVRIVIVKICSKCKGNDSCVYTKFGGSYIGNQQPRKIYEELILHKFEDSLFYIPKNYNAVLLRLYGNYMEYPPEHLRKGGHDIIDYDFGPYVLTESGHINGDCHNGVRYNETIN